MKEFIELVVFVGVYAALMKWVLPRFGVPTCMSSSCVGFRRTNDSEQQPQEAESRPETPETPRLP
jgi:hypothetical protein